MADMMNGSDARCLMVPGLNNSGPRHWQTRWEHIRNDCSRVDLGAWSNPHRNHWVTKLDMAIRQHDGPVVLVAHSLGCLAVAWWASLTEAPCKPVIGALLVAPPDVERGDARDVLQRFAPAPRVTLPFPSILVASRDDSYISFEAGRALARRWGADFHDAGAIGHINADSFLGDWEEGQKLVDRLLGVAGAQRGSRLFPLPADMRSAGLRGH